MARAGGAVLLAAVLVASGAAAAQATGNAVAPAATPGALPIPATPVIVLPTAATVSPTPRATPAPRAIVRATPTPRPAATASATPAPAPSGSAAQAPPAPSPSPTPVPTPSAAAAPPTAPATPVAAPAAGEPEVDRYWMAALVAVVLAALALAWVVLRRRRADPVEVEGAEEQGRLDEPTSGPDEIVALTTDATVPAKPAPSYLDRPAAPVLAQLTLRFRPIRVGLNLLSVTSENEVTITNDGETPVDDVRLQLRLVTAHAGLDAELDEIAAEPIVRPAVPPFALQPGERRVVNAVGALPNEAVQSLTAAGRPMFVPVVSVALAWRRGDEQRAISQAFAVGVERVDSAKLAPFWLDVAARSYDQVAARPHGPVRER